MFINGSLKVLYIKWDGEFLPVGCLTSNSFSESSETLDVTTRDNGGFRTAIPTMQSYSISFDGLIINTRFSGGDFTKVSYDRLRQLKRNRTKIEWKTQDTDLTFIDSGFGYITELSDSANIDEFISFNATIQGYGAPTSTTGLVLEITDGQGNNLEDGLENNIVTA